MTTDYDDPGYYEDEDDETASMDVLGPGGPRLLAEQCSTCIFRPRNKMGLRPGRLRQMVRDSLAGGGFIPCHDTIRRDDDTKPAICRGFFDNYGPDSNVLRIWGRLGGFVEVAPPDARHPTEGDQ